MALPLEGRQREGGRRGGGGAEKKRQERKGKVRKTGRIK